MSFDDFTHIVDDYLSNVAREMTRFTCCPYADLFAGGERIIPYLDYLFDRFGEAYFVTNGIGLTPSIQEYLATREAQIQFLRISKHVSNQHFYDSLVSNMHGILLPKLQLSTVVDRKKLESQANVIRQEQVGPLSLKVLDRAMHSWCGVVDKPSRPPQFTVACEGETIGWNRKLIIDIDGNVRMCCHDWGQGEPIGNALEKPIKRIWEEDVPRVNRIITQPYLQKPGFICHTCDYAVRHVGVPTANWGAKDESSEVIYPTIYEEKPIYIILVCMNRLEHLQRSLPSWLSQSYGRRHITIVDYSSDEPIEPAVRDILRKYPHVEMSTVTNNRVRSGVTLLRYEGFKFFNMSHAVNLGIRHSAQQDLYNSRFIVGTCDSLPLPHYTELVIHTLTNPHIFTRTYNGILGFHYQMWRMLNGYNEFIEGYGGEDSDFVSRARFAGFTSVDLHTRNMGLIDHTNAMRRQHNRRNMTVKHSIMQNYFLTRRYWAEYGFRGNFGHLGGNSSPVLWHDIEGIYLHVKRCAKRREMKHGVLSLADLNFGKPEVVYDNHEFVIYCLSSRGTGLEGYKVLKVPHEALGWDENKLHEAVKNA